MDTSTLHFQVPLVSLVILEEMGKMAETAKTASRGPRGRRETQVHGGNQERLERA